MRRLFFLTNIICILIFQGCGTTAQAPRTAYFVDINSSSKTVVEKDGLKVSIRSITFENYSSFPKIYTITTYTSTDNPGPVPLPFVLVALPAFEISITNTTGHILKFSRAVMKLQDNNGESYDVMLKNDLNANIASYVQNQLAQGIFVNQLPLTSQVNTMKIVDQNFEILPNFTEKGYLVFNIQQNSLKDYETFLSTKQYLKVLMYEIPTETDDAGIVKKTTNFEFIFDISAKTIQPNQGTK